MVLTDRPSSKDTVRALRSFSSDLVLLSPFSVRKYAFLRLGAPRTWHNLLSTSPSAAIDESALDMLCSPEPILTEIPSWQASLGTSISPL